jgi:CrcB protein
MRLFYVCVAGAVGSGLRYLAVEWAARLFGPLSPWGVLVVNVLGSFAIAFVMVVAEARGALGGDARIAITAGLLGGFTTYSSFNQDTLKLLEQRNYGAAAVYVGATLGVCLVAGVLGTALGKRIW